MGREMHCFRDDTATLGCQAARTAKRRDGPVQKGPEDFVLEAPVEFPEAILQVPETSPWQFSPSFG